MAIASLIKMDMFSCGDLLGKLGLCELQNKHVVSITDMPYRSAS